MFRKTPLVFVGNNRYELDLLRIGTRACLDRRRAVTLHRQHLTRWGMLKLALRAASADSASRATSKPSAASRSRKFDPAATHIHVALDGEIPLCSPPPLQLRPLWPQSPPVVVPASRDPDPRSWIRIRQRLPPMPNPSYPKLPMRSPRPHLRPPLRRRRPRRRRGLLDDLARQARTSSSSAATSPSARAAASSAPPARFSTRINAPQIVVPGNHDIPLYNVLPASLAARSYTASSRDNLFEPTFHDDELAVAGVNTARSNTWKDGRISARPDRAAPAHSSASARPTSTRSSSPTTRSFRRSTTPAPRSSAARRDALAMLEACGCHLILAGHLHLAYAGDVRPHHVEIKRSILVVQAGTAISHRRRDEANAYNLLTIDGDQLRLEVRTWTGQKFAPRGHTDYIHHDYAWTPA